MFTSANGAPEIRTGMLKPIMQAYVALSIPPAALRALTESTAVETAGSQTRITLPVSVHSTETASIRHALEHALNPDVQVCVVSIDRGKQRLRFHFKTSKCDLPSAMRIVIASLPEAEIEPILTLH